ncbi:MAG: MTH1187 family thiamine-binding protein [Methanobrevibacter sp.]|jgi:uncharacterized protein (TIGR00106 family)|nr:MTH1187 family thiamine-binding protein [Methanobrevibacter sp.]
MITADFTILPVGTDGTDLGEYVGIAVEIIKDSGLNYELTGMGTQIEAETLDELYEVVKKAQEAIFDKGSNRVYSVLKIDDRRDKNNRSLQDKINTVNEIVNK